MPTIVQVSKQTAESRKLDVDQEGLYLALACISLCLFAIALSLKFPSIAEAVALLS